MKQLYPLVSVLIPCYNAERFVEEAVRSVMNQTYQNLQIICIDDCSKDNTKVILQRLSEEDKRIEIICNEKNLKLALALNRGLELSRGEYIARMDADDICIPTRIEQQVRFMEQNQEIGICGGQCQIINANGKVSGRKTYPTSHGELVTMLQMRSCLAHPTVMFRRTVYEQIGGYADMMPLEDLDYWIRMAENGVGLANLPTVLLRYRVHGNNVTTSTNEERKLRKMSELFDRHRNFFHNPETWLDYNLRFFLGKWSERTDEERFKQIRRATNEIIKNTIVLSHHSLALRQARQKENLAYLCCAKSSQNSFSIRIRAAVCALIRLDMVIANFISKQ